MENKEKDADFKGKKCNDKWKITSWEAEIDDWDYPDSEAESTAMYDDQLMSDTEAYPLPKVETKDFTCSNFKSESGTRKEVLAHKNSKHSMHLTGTETKCAVGFPKNGTILEQCKLERTGKQNETVVRCTDLEMMEDGSSEDFKSDSILKNTYEHNFGTHKIPMDNCSISTSSLVSSKTESDAESSADDVTHPAVNADMKNSALTQPAGSSSRLPFHSIPEGSYLPHCTTEPEDDKSGFPKQVPQLDEVFFPQDDDDDDDGDEEDSDDEAEILRCSKCGETFDSSKSLLRHKLHHRVELELNKCPKCDGSFPNHIALTLHKNVHLPGYRKNWFKSRSVLYPGAQPVTCLDCKALFITKEALQRHSVVHGTTTKWFSCSDCGKSFIYPELASVHGRLVHGKRRRATPTSAASGSHNLRAD